MSARRVGISFFNSFNILVGRLFGSVDLSLFSKDIINFISHASLGVINNDSSIRGWIKYWNDLFENLTLVLVFSVVELKETLKLVSAISIKIFVFSPNVNR